MPRIVNIARPLVRSATRRNFHYGLRAMAGETGGTRSGGERSGDAFTKREKGNEDMYIKQEERAKMLALKEKMIAEKKHLDELIKHVDEINKESGGEQH